MDGKVTIRRITQESNERLTPPPSSLSTFSRVLIGSKRGEEGKKVSGILHEQFRVHSHALRDFILGELRA